MLSKLAASLAKRYIAETEKSEDKTELYSYAFFHMLSFAAFFALAILYGAILKILLQSIVFFISFWLIRIYAGGFHAKTEAACAVLSSAGLLLFITAIKLSDTYGLRDFVLALAASAAVFIYLFCPLGTPQKQLSEKEFKYFRKISLIILSAICITIITALFLNIKFLIVPLCCSLIFEGVLIVAGKIKAAAQVRQKNK